MTLRLHFGCVDMPYEDGKTTGDVAEILEARYHPFEIYWEIHQQDIMRAMETGLGDALDNLMVGGPTTQNPFGDGEQEAEQGFRDFLDNREMEALGYPGVPTQAALKGVNHRLKRPYVKSNPRRPSFIDTGLYETSARIWMEAIDWDSMAAGAVNNYTNAS